MHALRLMCAASFLLSLAGCGDSAAPLSDAGPRADGAVVGDAGPPRDAGPRMDGGSGADAGPGTDAGPDFDAGPDMDAGPAPGIDAGPAPGTDAGPAPTTDAGPMPRPMIAGCAIFPADNPWNQDVTTLPLHPRAAEIGSRMNRTRALHADWGNWSVDHYGIPWTSGAGAPALTLTITTAWGAGETDPLPCPGGGGMFCYPIPSTSPIEGGSAASSGSDRHVLYLDTAGAPGDCTLYELYNAQNFTGPGWRAANGAIFHLGTNALRPEGWTSADAAGLPILPGLVRVDEVLAGEIRHALRFTMASTARAYIHPATHAAGDVGTDLPPMGLRVRLRADYPVAGAPAPAQVILRAMQTYGMLLADNGSDWYVTGDSDDRWNAIIDDVITGLGAVHGSDFEILDTGPSLPM